jgi:hypothetical protein
MSEGTIETRPEDLVREMDAALSRRIDVLERQNQSLRRNSLVMVVAVCVMAALTAALVVGAGSDGRVADTLEARRFVLRDAGGAVRAVLGMTPDGAARLVLQDREGRERMKLTLLPDGSPGLSFADRDGRSRAVLGLLADETSTLVFADRQGLTRAVLGLSTDGSSTLVFAGPDGEARVGVGVESDGSAGMTLFEREAAPGLEPAPSLEPGADAAADEVAAASR